MDTNEYTIKEILQMGIDNWKMLIPVVVLILAYVFIFAYMHKRGISIDSQEKVRQKAQKEGRTAIGKLRSSSFTWTKDDQRHYCGNYEFEVDGKLYKQSVWFWNDPPEHLMFYWKKKPSKAKPESTMGKGNLWVYVVPWVLAVIVYLLLTK